MSIYDVTQIGAAGVAHLDDTAIKALASAVEGRVLLPADDGFDEAVTIWNGMIEKRPSFVVQPETTSDVVNALAFAQEHQLELSIKGGGHNIAGLSLSDGGMTIDMGRMRKVDVDANGLLAAVDPGCTLGDVDEATQEYGLATTLGFVSLTGAAGLTLGGGFGYLTRQFGWTTDDLDSVEIVTADGRILRASRGENADLFWAVRGGGGNFGIVTRFVYRLHHIGPKVTAGLIAWSADSAEEVLKMFKDVTASAPRELTLAVLMRNAPAAPWLEEHQHGEPIIVIVVNHTGSDEQAEEDLETLRSFGTPWADLIQRKNYADQQAMLDATQPTGMHYYWKSEFLPGLTDEVLDVYRSQFDGLNAPANQIVLFHLEGALNEHDEDDGAIGNRDAAYAAVVQSMHSGSPGEAESNTAWVRRAWLDLKRFSTGGNYINFHTDDETDERIAESYRVNMDRLRKVKAAYDPENFFRMNRNILP